MQLLYDDQSYVDLLIDKGLLSDNILIRNQFKDQIEYMCKHIKSENLVKQTAKFFLDVLQNKLSQVCTNANSRSTEQYFDLLKMLFSAYYTHLRNQQQLSQSQNFKQFIIEAFELLNRYQVNESRYSNIWQDSTLIGLLQLINIMLLNEPEDCLNENEKSAVLKFIVTDCLFSKPMQEIQIHITKNVDVKSLSNATLNKCHSQLSREAAYALFKTVIGNNPTPQLVQQQLWSYWGPKIMKLEKPNSSSSHVAPSERSRSPLGFAGIKNLGSICYMNSMIQQFYHVPAFRYCLLAANDAQPQNLIQTPAGKTLDDNNLHQWMRMFGFLELTDRQDYNPEDFTYSFKQAGGQLLDVRVQQDAQEFLGNAFDKLENSLKDTPMKYLCQSVFQGKSTNLTICKNCNNINQTDEDFYALPCSVRDQKNLYESLKNLVSGETISDYNCEKCKQKVSIEKQFAIKQLPNTLIVHLKRLDFDFNTMRNVKLNDKLEFPNKLNMSKYMLSEVIQDIKKKQKSIVIDKGETQSIEDNKEEENTEMKVEEEVQKIETAAVEEDQPANDADFEYKLVGVVVHMGGADAGHYVSLINIERELDPHTNPEEWMKTEKQTWLEFNDSQVRPFDFTQLGNKCYGEQVYRSNNITTSTNYIDENSQSAASQTNAYMLFYEKRIKSDLILVVDENTIDFVKEMTSNPLACDGTAIPRALQQPHSCLVYPQITDRVVQEKIEPNTRINVPFYDIQKFVPNHIYSQVSKDNQHFMAEKQVYDPNFFETTNFLLDSLILATNNQNILNVIYTLVDRLLFDILFYSNYSTQLDKLCQNLMKIIAQNHNFVSKLLMERILKQEKAAGQLLDFPFFEELIFNRSQEVRENMEMMLTKITSLFCAKLKNYHELSPEQKDQLEIGHEQLIQGAFSYLKKSESFSGQAIPWHKLGAYLNFFYNSLKLGDWSTIILLKRENLVQKLVELISKYKDNMNSQHYNPPFENAIKTISMLARAQPLVIYLYGMSHEKQVKTDEYEELLEQIGASPYYAPIDEQQLYLSALDIKSLFMSDKKCKFFWEVSIQLTTSQEAREELFRLIQHVCYKNYDISKKIAKILVYGLNYTQVDSIKPYATLMEHFLTIPDQFQQTRIEWIFGLQSISMAKQSNQHYYNNSPEVHKIGASNINEISAMIHDYSTTPFKVSSTSTEALGLILYKYRQGSFAEVVLVLLEHITKAILNQFGMPILQFLLETDGPAYTCRRYWDWITPYITQAITESYQVTTSTTFVQEILFRILGNLEQINQTYKQLVDTHYVREPYLVWKIDASQEYRTIEMPSKQFHVVLEEFVTTISESNPQPALNTNLNIEKVSKNWLTQMRYVPANSQTSHQVEQLQSNPQVVKRQDAQQDSSEIACRKVSRGENAQVKDFQNSPMLKKHYGRGTRQPKPNKVYRNKQVGQEFYDDFQNNQDEFMSGDDETDKHQDNQPPKIKIQSSINEDQYYEQRYNSSNEGDKDSLSQNRNHSEEAINQDEDQALLQDLGAKNEDGEPIFGVFEPQNVNPNEEPEREFQFDDGKGSDPVFENNQQSNNQDQDTHQNEEEKQNSQEDAVQQQQQKTKYQQATVMQIKLRNFNLYKMQTCTIVFDQNPDANYYVPKSDINYQVSARTDFISFRIMKYRPNEPWGSLKLYFYVDNEDQNGVKHKLLRNWPDLRAKRDDYPPDQIIDPEPEPPIEDQIEVTNNLECQVCTYINSYPATVCDMCGTELGKN